MSVVVSMVVTIAAITAGAVLLLVSGPALLLWVRVLRARRRGLGPCPDADRNAAETTGEIPAISE